MKIEPENVYTRKDLAAYFNCSYNTARKIYARMYNTIEKQLRRPEHKRYLKGNIVLTYLDAAPTLAKTR